MPRKIIILTEGHTEPHAGTTAATVSRYRRQDVVALLDSTQQGKSSRELLAVKEDVPIVGKLDDAPQADTLLLGIAPPGGKIPANWRAIILDAISRRKMEVISGLHDFLSADPEFSAAGAKRGVKLTDIR